MSLPPLVQNELKKLVSIANKQSLRRYGDFFYTKTNKLKQIRSIREFAWGYCSHPCYANTLAAELKKIIPDYKKFLSILARANKKIVGDNLYETWEEAMNVVEPLTGICQYPIAHTIENSCMWTDRILRVTDVDGDIWNGILFTQSSLANLDTIQLQLDAKNSDGMDWGRIYEWSGKDVVTKCKHLLGENEIGTTDWYLFTPFKHPLILKNVDLKLKISVHFFDGRKPTEEDIKTVFGVCSEQFCDWLSNEKFKLELGFGDKYIIDTTKECIDHTKC